MTIDPTRILLTGRVAVVTGGGSGIGRGIAAGMTAFGASVAIWERNPDTCAQVAESIGALGITTDVRDSAQVDAALERTTAELGPVTVLVNNAGGVFKSPLLETSENGWDALYRANLRHVLLCTHRVARRLVAVGLPGSIINLTSIEGVRAAPGYAAYAAAKAGVINYTKTAALELAPHAIRVNAIAPDITLTEGLDPRRRRYPCGERLAPQPGDGRIPTRAQLANSTRKVVLALTANSRRWCCRC
jgi:3-oxoacyl-[acyl-carrier protein] reductase